MSRIFDSSANAPEINTNSQNSTPPSRQSRLKGLIVITIMAVLCVTTIASVVAGVIIYRSKPTALGGILDPKQPKTKLEAFQVKAGIVIVKSYSEIMAIAGTPSGMIGVEAVELQDRTNLTRALGLVVDIKPAGEYTQHSRSFIDFDETDSLLKGIDYIGGVTSATPPLKNFEARYKTRGDFSVVTFNQSDGKIAAVVSSGFLVSNQVFLTTADLSKLRQAIVSAKETLEKISK